MTRNNDQSVGLQTRWSKLNHALETLVSRRVAMTEKTYRNRLKRLLLELTEVHSRLGHQRREVPRPPTISYGTTHPVLGSEFTRALPRPTYWRW
jgi:hypothetical protein